MQNLSLRLLGNAARQFRAVAPRQRSLSVGSRHHFSDQLRTKSTVTNRPEATAPPQTSASASPAAPAAASKPAEQVAVPSQKAGGAATAVAKEGTGAQTIPDVHSTSLGIEDPDANDPLKWRKFAWKYAGAVVVFLVAYKTVNWYADKLETEAKQQRKAVEENKLLKKKYEADREKAHAMLNMAQGGPMAGPGAQQQQAQQQAQQSMSLFKPVQEEEGFVSELDELCRLQVELEAKLKALKKERRQTDEVMNKRQEIEGELKDLEREMVELEKIEARRKGR